MTKLAADGGLGRENLYNAVKPGAKPRFDTIPRVCRALGVELAVRPLDCRRFCVVPYRNNSLRGKRAAPTSKVTKRERPRWMARAQSRQSAKSALGNWSNR